ncbi:MAG: metallophosphoesterase family protein [Planctomycetota bacterium]
MVPRCLVCILSQRLIAIGDIHGCRVALEELLQWIAPTQDDILVTLGDYVDRGPDAKGVVEVLLELGKNTQMVPLMGNHEEMMLDVLDGRESHHGWLRYGGVETLESYGFDGDMDFLPEEHSQFYRDLHDYFETDQFFFTHAAYDPGTDFAEQTIEMLRWHSLRQGIPGPHMSGKTAVVGHTANHEGEVFDVGHLVCIDTFCYGGGYLTAIDLHSRQTWQVDGQGQRRAPA